MSASCCARSQRARPTHRTRSWSVGPGVSRERRARFPEAKRLLGALANSRGHRHEENAAKLVNAAIELPVAVGAALLASAEGYTPRATQLIEAARERLGTVQEVAGALAENLPQPKVASGRSRRRKRRKRKKGGSQPQQQQQQQQAQQAQAQQAPATQGQEQQAGPAEEKKPKPRPRKKPTPKAKPASAETPAA